MSSLEEKHSENEIEKQLKECLDDSMEEEYHQLWHLLWIGGLAAIVMGAALWISPWVFDSVGDPEGLYRWAIIKFPQALMTIFILIGSVCLADLVFPGDLLKRVIHEPVACAIVIAALFLSVGMTLM